MDEEYAGSKGEGGDYDRLALTEQVDWVDDPSEEDEDDGEGGNLPEADGLMRSNDDDDDMTRASSMRSHPCSIWNTCLLSDERFSICGVQLLDGAPAVKLLKFVVVTFVAICLMHQFLRTVVSCCENMFRDDNVKEIWQHFRVLTLDFGTVARTGNTRHPLHWNDFGPMNRHKLLVTL